jgi:cobalt-zinc-cadmium efflux system membrane fusion protein
MRKPSWLWVPLYLSLHLGCSRQEKKPASQLSLPIAAPTRASLIIPSDSPKLGQIRVEPARMAEVPTDEVISPGKIEVNPNRVSRVLLPVTGRIESVLVRLGDAVATGQPLLEMQSPDADAAMSTYLQADASVTQAQASFVKAQADFDRASDLYQHNAIAKKEVLSTENALTQAKAAVEQAKASREQTSRHLQLLDLKAGAFGQKVVVRAPIAGKVLEISVAPGEYRNDTNSPIMTVADLSSVWVASDVPESYIRFIQLSERLEINLVAYPRETFFARVTRIADTVDPQTRTVKVMAEMDNSRGRFRPQMFGNIHHIESTQQMVVVPVGTVIQGDGESTVFVEQGPGRFEQIPVKVGKRIGEITPVLSGLKSGQRVVVDGGMLLKGL